MFHPAPPQQKLSPTLRWHSLRLQSSKYFPQRGREPLFREMCLWDQRRSTAHTLLVPAGGSEGGTRTARRVVRPTNGFRIAPALVANRDSKCQRPILENPPFSTRGINSFLGRIQLHFILKARNVPSRLITRAVIRSASSTIRSVPSTTHNSAVAAAAVTTAQARPRNAESGDGGM